MNGAGHVFVIRGRLEHLDHDVTLLPTDQWFDVSRHWDPSLGLDTSLTSGGRKEALALLRPEGWKDRRFGMATQATPGSPPTPTWFVDTAVDSGDVKASRDRKIGRLTGILDAIAASALPNAAYRPRPLVAMPTVGVGAGGFGGSQEEACASAVGGTLIPPGAPPASEPPWRNDAQPTSSSGGNARRDWLWRRPQPAGRQRRTRKSRLDRATTCGTRGRAKDRDGRGGVCTRRPAALRGAVPPRRRHHDPEG